VQVNERFPGQLLMLAADEKRLEDFSKHSGLRFSNFSHYV
jgi:hypothetical protein